MKQLFPFSLILVLLVGVAFKEKAPAASLKQMKKLLKEGYSFVPSGSTIIENDTVSFQGFFMMKGEVTNFHYLEYLSDLKRQGKTSEYQKALLDTAQWSLGTWKNSKYTDYYFNHPVYRNYPVVNVTREQAEAYCVWLSENWRKKTGNESLVFRLPKRAEFLRAANGNKMIRSFAWDGPFIRSNNGLVLCNHLALSNTNITRDTVTNELKVITNFDVYLSNPFTDITAPSISYFPNEFDLYNLNGNVSELVHENGIVVGGDWNSPGYDVRNQSVKKYSGASPMVGFRPVMTFIEK